MEKPKRIYMISPHMSNEGYEMEFVREAFETNWIAPLGKNVDEFENEIARYVRAENAAALSSGTVAIHMALKAVGVCPGDIVFCPSLTFAASANPILYQNAIPVFIDSDRETWNMDPKALEKALIRYEAMGKLPKALIVVHLYGISANMDAICGLCERYDIPIIEDAAESLGTIYKGKYLGTIGDYGIYSFNGNKIITTSGGGMLVSSHAERIRKVRFWATQSRDPARHYQHSELGYNYKMSNVVAGIGRGQMKVIEQRIQRKKEIFEFYQEELGKLQGVRLMPVLPDTRPIYWLSCMTMEGRVRPENVMDALEKENIETRPLWKPLHMQPFFSGYDHYGGQVSEFLFKNGLCLPSDTKMTDDDLKRIVRIIRNLWR